VVALVVTPRWEFEIPSPVAQEVSEPESYGFLNTITSEDGSSIPDSIGGGSSDESHAVFTSACRMSEPRCSGLKNSEEPGSWVRPHHRMVLSSVISGIPKAHSWVLLESHDSRLPSLMRSTGRPESLSIGAWPV